MTTGELEVTCDNVELETGLLSEVTGLLSEETGLLSEVTGTEVLLLSG